jgi:hypothetical protein
MRAIVFSLLLLSLAAGCGSSSGGGGAGSSTPLGGSTASSTSAGSSSAASSDFTAPVLNVTAPARGAYLDRQTNPGADVLVEGTVTDAGTGVASVAVNGVVVTPTAGRFSATVPLKKGGNPIIVTATDVAGNIARGIRSVVFAEAFDAGAQPVARALGARLTDGAFAAIAPIVMNAVHQSGLIQQQILNGGQPIYRDQTNLPSWLGGGCSLSIQITTQSVSFDPPTLAFDCRPGEINARIDIPNLRVSAEADDYCGVPWFAVTGDVTATNAEVQISLAMGVDPATGRITAAATNSTVILHGYDVDFTNLPGNIIGIFPVASAIRGPIESAVEDILRREVPPRVEAELNGLFQPISSTWNGNTATFTPTPGSIALDADGLTFACTADVTAPPLAGMPVVPGSYFDPAHGVVLPLFAPLSPEISAAVLSNMWNRAFHRTWQAGFFTFRIDQAFLNNQGVPFQLAIGSGVIASNVPQLAGLLPAGMTIPLAIDLDPRCQPILVPTPGQPDQARLVLPELHVRVAIDLGAGFFPLLEFATHAELGLAFTVRNGHELAFALGTANPVFEAELLSSLIPTGGLDLGRMLSTLGPGALTIAATSFAPLPIASLPGAGQPLLLQNASITVDGQANDYLVIEGDL